MHHASLQFTMIGLPIALIASSVQASEARVQCANSMSETRCGGEECVTTMEDFTPVRLHVEGKRVELCAYPGCREGAVSYHHAAGGTEFLLTELQSGERETTTVSIMLNRDAGYAQVGFSGFALAMECADQD